MRKNKKLTMIAIILIIVGVVGSLATTNTIKKPETVIENIENDTFTKIIISSDNAIINVLPTEEAKAKVEVTGLNLKKNFKTHIEDETLIVKYKEKGIKLFNFSFGFKKRELTLYLPEKEYQSIIATSNNGKITLKNILAEETKVSTNNGQITADQIVANHAEMSTDNGKIDVQNLELATASLSTSNGKIVLTNVTGEVSAKTDNGGINYQAATLEYPLDLKTDNGRIEIATDQLPTNARIEAQTDNGSITLFGEKTAHQTYGAGENEVRLKTDNGKIIVE